jgi:hypothetical protein
VQAEIDWHRMYVEDLAEETEEPEPEDQPALPAVEQLAPPPVEEEEEDGLEAFYERLADLPEESVEERITMVREAIGEHPDDPDAYWLAVHELQFADRTEVLAGVLRQAVERGMEQFLPVLASVDPESLTIEEVTKVGDDDDHQVKLEMAAALVRRGELSEGLALAEATLKQTEDLESTPGLVVRSLLDLVLALIERDQIDHAEALLERLDARLQETGDELRSAPSVGVGKWLLTRELAASARSLWPKMRRGLARAIADGTFEGPGIDDIRDTYRWRPKRLVDAAGEIRDRAPNLAQALKGLAHDLQVRPPPAEGGGQGSIGKTILILVSIGAFLSLARHCGSLFKDPTPEPSPEFNEALRNLATGASDALKLQREVEELCRRSVGGNLDGGVDGLRRPSHLCDIATALRSENPIMVCTALNDLKTMALGPTSDAAPLRALAERALFLTKVELQLQKRCGGRDAASRADAAQGDP